MNTGIRLAVAAGLASGALWVAPTNGTDIVLDEAELDPGQRKEKVERKEHKEQDRKQQAKAERDEQFKLHRQRMSERRKADEEFWRGLKDMAPADALSAVIDHVGKRHAERKAEAAAVHAQMIERIKAKADGDEEKQAQRIEVAERRRQTREATMDKLHAEVLGKLEALKDKEDLTLADIRKALPGRKDQRPNKRPPEKRGQRRKGGHTETTES